MPARYVSAAFVCTFFSSPLLASVSLNSLIAIPSKPTSLRLLLVQSILVASVAGASRRSCRPRESVTPVTSLSVISTSTLDLSTSTEVVSTSEPVITTTSESETSSAVEVTPTSNPVITTTSEAEPAPTQTSPSLPSSTAAEPSTTTPEGPSLTTITDCPPTPTYNGNPEYCYNPKLPAACDKLTSTFMYRSLSMSLAQCMAILTQYGMPVNPIATACFPTSVPMNPLPSLSAALTSTASSVWSCLQTASLVCESDSNCITNTYTVGQVPTPTPSIGVNLLTNSGFESGNFNDWALSGFNQYETVEVSAARPRTGAYGVLVRFLNTNGVTGNIQRTVHVEPGKQYSFSYWYYHENPGATVSIYQNVNPGQFRSDFNSAQLYQTPANQWFQRTLTFTATTSFVQLQVSIGGNVAGGSGNPSGLNNVWIDDVALTRLN